ncbi:SEN1 N terminal-domain-containing protein [Elsinoe ampelina]|uniref:SEN1 N terminal-domain-containing protein n=1 Tax=Elsinoe ampelina TaxID=302913 RepID=A0A6A6GN71_9PEZI|nr:SEN1 N terminal-domain-containing protein [Elsinoe ampelina]
MAEIVGKIEELKGVPEETHWFCPREKPSDDDQFFFDEDMVEEDETAEQRGIRHKRVEKAHDRRSIFLEAVSIFAYDGDDAVPFQKAFEESIAGQLVRCPICIREYHKCRSLLEHDLQAQYEAGQVQQFMDRFDGVNKTRIKNGLEAAKQDMLDLPPQDRKINKLSSQGLYALLETMHCMPVITDEAFLAENFDQAFKLVQSKKKITLPGYSPALTMFLFSNNEQRLDFAIRCWEKMQCGISGAQFDWAVKDQLSMAMARVQLTSLEREFMPSFWRGVRMIVDRLDRNVIAHHLRAMDTDICKLALDHLQVDSPCFNDLLATLQMLWEKAPSHVWDAFGAISPKTVIEQIFNSPNLRRIAQDSGVNSTSALSNCLTWIVPFLASLRPGALPNACKSLLHQAWDKYYDASYPKGSRLSCRLTGLRVLSTTFSKIDIEASDAGSAISSLLDVLKSHLNSVMEDVEKSPTNEIRLEALQVIRQAIAADVMLLAIDRDALKRRKPPALESDDASMSLWQASIRGVKSHSFDLASAIIQGCSRFPLFEALPVKESSSPEARNWTQRLNEKHEFLSDLFDRMQDFPPHALKVLLQNAERAEGLLSLLFAGDSTTQQSAASLIKVLTSENNRGEAIKSLLRDSFVPSMQALAAVLRNISQAQVFGPAQMTVKAGKDFISALSDSSDGIVRLRSLSDEDIDVVEDVWQAFWTEINTIFQSTEAWALMGHSKDLMVAFCRDAMDFANMVFDAYSVISGALHDSASSETSRVETDRHLLAAPANTAAAIVTWFRLRDEYLISKAVDFACKIMTRLRTVEVELPAKALEFIEGILSNEIRNKVPANIKARLRKSFEVHVDEVLITDSRPVGKQGSLLPWMSSGSSTPSEFRRKRQQALEEKKRRDAAAIAKARRQRDGLGNAGSGLAGIGVDDKDHSAAKGEGVMVSSDESDDDDEGGLDAELFGPASKTTKSKNSIKMDSNGVVGLKKEVKPTRVIRQVRNKKDMRARLAPDLGPLHKIILGWDFFHEGDYPPGSEDWQFKKVSNAFRHAQEYRDTFQPLLTLEAWQAIVRAREEDSPKPYKIKIGSRSSVDAFVEISTAISHADLREAQLSEGDIILLSTATKPTSDKEAPNCLSRVDKVKRKGKTVEVIYKVLPHGNGKASAMLKPGAEIFGDKVQSIIPLEREFGSISGLEYYDLCDEIVKARPSPLLQYNDKQLDPLISNYNVNKAQAKAIKSALDNDAFTLIQGPPGSGKTKTIVAIVGALLTDSLGSTAGTTRINTPRGAGQAGGDMAKKLLVCAPSNAAVDELVMRFKDGIKTTRGSERKINVVRLGRSEAINSAVQDVTLDELVNKKLGNANGDNGARERTQAIMGEHKKVSELLREAREKMDSDRTHGDDKPKLQDDINALRKRKNDLGTQIDAAKDAEGAAGRNQELERRRIQQAVIDDSHIICATLSGSGHELFQNLNVEFETVVVDEAAQCVEMSALIPLKYGCAKCILVGDPKQLPPTVFSKEAARFQYEQSLFVRMQGNHPDAVHLLDTQYRMHPDISSFPSASFYDSRLLDGDGMEALRARPWHTSSLLAPYRFFDVSGQHEKAVKGPSLVNRNEIQVALSLYNRLTQDFADYDFDKKIGIITPYKSQLRMLKETFARQFGDSIMDKVEFNTTDAFQGRESEIIIFSCVRASPAGGIGFLQDIRRMNVGLTRAKCSLWVLGNSQSLIRGQWWKKLVEDAQARDVPSKDFPAKARVAKSKPQPSTIKTEHSNGKPNGVHSPKPQDLDIFRPAEKEQPSVVQRKPSSDRMEGIKVKAEDRIKGMKRERQSSVSEDKMDIDSKEEMKFRNDVKPAKKQLMDDVRSSEPPRSRTTTPGAPGTPGSMSNASDRDVKTEVGKDRGEVKKVHGGMVQSKPPQGPPLKRKAAGSVFMPKKKK